MLLLPACGLLLLLLLDSAGATAASAVVFLECFGEAMTLSFLFNGSTGKGMQRSDQHEKKAFTQVHQKLGLRGVVLLSFLLFSQTRQLSGVNKDFAALNLLSWDFDLVSRFLGWSGSQTATAQVACLVVGGMARLFVLVRILCV